MITVVSLISGVGILVIIISRYTECKNLLDPIVLYLFIQFISYVPSPLLNASEHYTIFTDENVTLLWMWEWLYIISVLASFSYFRRKRAVALPPIVFSQTGLVFHEESTGINRVPLPRTLIYCIFAVGFAAKLYTFHSLGGIAFVAGNMSQAYSMQSSGFGYVSILYRLMLVAIVVMLDRFLLTKNRHDALLLVLMILLYAGSYLIYSSRGPALQVILIVFFCIGIEYRRYMAKDLLNKWIILIVCFTGIASMVALSLRTNENKVDSKFLRPDKIVIGLADEFSRAGRDIYVYNYFNHGNNWNGKVFLNLLYAPVPTSVYPNKPPIDDGLYLKNIMLGHPPGPNTGREDLYYDAGSIPFTTQGMMYANFGPLGIIIAGLLTGWVYHIVSKESIKRRGLGVYFGVVYFEIMYMFGLTTLLITNTIVDLIMFIPIGFLVYKKYRSKSSNDAKSEVTTQ